MSRHLPTFAAIMLLAAGCRSLLPARMFTVTDEAGVPMEAVGLTPYPMIAFGQGNATGADGSIRLYRTGESNLLSKAGYELLWVRFDDTNGVYIMRRAAAPDRRARFHAALNAYLKSISSDPVPTDGYDPVFTDLNGDGIEEAVALMNGKTDWAGTGGSTLFVFEGTADGYRFVSRSTLTRKPIYVRDTIHHGWRDLIVYGSGGGGNNGFRLLVFDGATYPLNPSTQPFTTITDRETPILPAAGERQAE